MPKGAQRRDCSRLSFHYLNSRFSILAMVSRCRSPFFVAGLRSGCTKLRQRCAARHQAGSYDSLGWRSPTRRGLACKGTHLLGRTHQTTPACIEAPPNRRCGKSDAVAMPRAVLRFWVAAPRSIQRGAWSRRGEAIIENIVSRAKLSAALPSAGLLRCAYGARAQEARNCISLREKTP